MVKIAKSYRDDFLLLKRFIKEHFKTKEMLLKNSMFMKDEALKEILNDCFEETPLVVMCFASPLVMKIYDTKTNQEYSKEMQLLDFKKEFEGATEGIRDTGK